VHAALARHPADLDAAAAALAATALARCSQDNITVQLARVDALPPAEAQAAVDEQRSLPFPPPLQARMRFEGYTLLRELHSSARSQVWLATDDASGQPVALKVPAQDLRADAQAIDRFLLEEWVARRIDHPHVLKPAGGRATAAPAPLRGHGAHRRPDPGAVDARPPRPGLAEVRPWVQQIAAGLQAFHRKEMLHQDLRPENLMIDRTGTLKLIDFGSVHVAGLAEAGLSERDPALAGTLQYLAPEYFVGHPPGVASELFSLAVLTYQMLSGQLPYGLQVPRLRSPRDLAGLRYIPLRQHRPDLPAWLDTVLAKALHPQPARRHEALSEFTHALAAGPTLGRAGPRAADRAPPGALLADRQRGAGADGAGSRGRPAALRLRAASRPRQAPRTAKLAASLLAPAFWCSAATHRASHSRLFGVTRCRFIH
jgi:hypothetical protein